MLDALLKGLLLGFWLAISVGPIVFTVIKQSLDNGWRGGLAFIFGIFAVPDKPFTGKVVLYVNNGLAQ